MTTASTVDSDFPSLLEDDHLLDPPDGDNVVLRTKQHDMNLIGGRDDRASFKRVVACLGHAKSFDAISTYAILPDQYVCQSLDDGEIMKPKWTYSTEAVIDKLRELETRGSNASYIPVVLSIPYVTFGTQVEYPTFGLLGRSCNETMLRDYLEPLRTCSHGPQSCTFEGAWTTGPWKLLSSFPTLTCAEAAAECYNNFKFLEVTYELFQFFHALRRLKAKGGTRLKWLNKSSEVFDSKAVENFQPTHLDDVLLKALDQRVIASVSLGFHQLMNRQRPLASLATSSNICGNAGASAGTRASRVS